jgi:hypothetical protein
LGPSRGNVYNSHNNNGVVGLHLLSGWMTWSLGSCAIQHDGKTKEKKPQHFQTPKKGGKFEKNK